MSNIIWTRVSYFISTSSLMKITSKLRKYYDRINFLSSTANPQYSKRKPKLGCSPFQPFKPQFQPFKPQFQPFKPQL